jgi:hypothetical protein
VSHWVARALVRVDKAVSRLCIEFMRYRYLLVIVATSVLYGFITQRSETKQCFRHGVAVCNFLGLNYLFKLQVLFLFSWNHSRAWGLAVTTPPATRLKRHRKGTATNRGMSVTELGNAARR